MLGFNAKMDGPGAKRKVPFAQPFRARFSAIKRKT